MKRILVVLLISVFALSAASYAAISSKPLAIGFQGLTITSAVATLPTIQYQFNPGFIGELGLSFVNWGSPFNRSNYTVALAGKFPLETKGNIRKHWGVGLAYVSNPALAANTTLIGLVLNGGIEVFVQDDLSIEANITPLSVWSVTAGGTTTTTISVLNSVLFPSVVIGAHYYIQ